jgi:CRISPR-associated protein Cmr6
MENSNISWLFYKDYFQGMSFDGNENDKKLIKTKNSKLTGSSLKVVENVLAQQRITTVIQYPGLATGVGINHEAGVEGEFKLGLHFDYTYGMPVIYGSSVKGVLRSAFPEMEVPEKEHEKESEKENRIKKNKLRNCKIDLINEYLGKNLEPSEIDELRKSIFDGTIDGEAISIYQRDVFFDAVIVKPNKKRQILASDSITPHKKLQEPNPITFLKIASGVTIEFRFNLKDGIISADKKLNLFKKIILDFGIGAKTNVGYGQITI